MNKKALGVFVSLLVVAMLALPMSAAFAEKPTIELTLTGKYWMMDPDPDHMKMFPAGNSGNTMFKLRDFVSVWTEDIAGSGVYNGNWVSKPDHTGAFAGCFILEDVTIDGIDGTGDLRIGALGSDFWIESGSGAFRSIRGKGTTTRVSMIEYDYELEIQINP